VKSTFLSAITCCRVAHEPSVTKHASPAASRVNVSWFFIVPPWLQRWNPSGTTGEPPDRATATVSHGTPAPGLSLPAPGRYIGVSGHHETFTNHAMTAIRPRGLLGLALLPLALAGCGGGEGGGGGAMQDGEDAAAPAAASNRIIELLASGQVVFGIFSGEHTPEGGRLMAQNSDADFVFYSLESGPFDLDAMEAYIAALDEASGGAYPPIALRIPPIRDDREAAVDRTRRGLASGATSIVYPHVESPEDVALASGAVGDRLWPVNPMGDVVNVLLIEDQSGIERARDIVGTAGAGVVIPGPGDLRRAYEGDMEAVENAIQAVLAACLELDVPCGITAGVDDIGTRIDQGFRFFIVTEPNAIAVGRSAAGRMD
jgi:2-keto-3-deoxy-L-rhamnonate aldolase RhmA